MAESATLHDIWASGLPFGVSCQHCLHRSLVEPRQIGAARGDRTLIDTLPFICTKCGHRTFTTHLFTQRGKARRFMAEYR